MLEEVENDRHRPRRSLPGAPPREVDNGPAAAVNLHEDIVSGVRTGNDRERPAMKHMTLLDLGDQLRMKNLSLSLRVHAAQVAPWRAEAGPL